MEIKKFIQLRNVVYDKLQEVTKDFIPLITATDTINVPFNIDGTMLEVAKKVPYEKKYTPFRAIGADFLRSIGAYGAIPTFRNNIGEVLESLTPSQIQNLFNPAPDEQKEENK